MDNIVIRRSWCMPNKNTFTIPPIKEIIERNIVGKMVVADPFANENKFGTITNDLDKQYDTDYHLDALDFLRMFDNETVDVVLFDPPYSPPAKWQSATNRWGRLSICRQHRRVIGAN